MSSLLYIHSIIYRVLIHNLFEYAPLLIPAILVMSMSSKATFFDTNYPLAFAHRGGDERFPENTLAAFQDAYDLGYRYFETDVHYTIDNELVAFHDDNLRRTLGLHGNIASLTKADRAVKLLNDTYQVPLLSDLLEQFPDVYFNIDAKSRAAIGPLVKVITRQHAEHRVCLASFSSSNIQALRHLLPNVPTIATRYEASSLRLISPVAKLMGSSTRYLEIPEHLFHEQRFVRILNHKFISKLHANGHKVFIWTVNDSADMHRLLDMGVDGLFTDKLRILKEVLISRKQWPKA